MFFIGIFGVSQSQKELNYNIQSSCKNCGCIDGMYVFMTYSFFHIFFIPIIKWNKKYFVNMKCCGKIYELDYEVGQKLEKGQDVFINSNNLKDLGIKTEKENTCPNCGSALQEDFIYCPKCGLKIK